MYFATEASRAARLAALDHFHLASSILLDSSARLADLYSGAASRVLGLAGRGMPVPPQNVMQDIVPELVMGHLQIAGYAHVDLIHLLEAQIHSSSHLTKYTLDKTAWLSPPEVEIAINSVESLIDAGEKAVDELGAASVQVVEKKLKRRPAAKS
jgi:hypothetical protein